MSNTQVFDDRFFYGNPSFAAVENDIDTLSDATIESLSPILKEMANTVRRHSVLLRKKTTKEIFYTIVQHSDPRIALVLAAARDKAGLKLFPTLINVKEAMFGPLLTDDTLFLDAQNNIFVQGIKRVSAALAASVLIGQLAQIPEQAKHADVLEAQALADLDRIISVPDLLQESVVKAKSLQEATNQAFFFEDKEFSLNSSLNVSVFLSSDTSPTWTNVGTFSGIVTTANIVIAISDAINTQTLSTLQGNIVASPIISGKNGFHRIEFSARRRDSIIQNELIIVKITNTENAIDIVIPFKWGTEANWLGYGKVNSAILTVQQGKTTTATSTASADKTATNNITVLYFKRASVNQSGQVLTQNGEVLNSAVWSDSPLVYRISPTQQDSISIPLTRELSADPIIQSRLDALRPSKVALSLLNSLFDNKGSTKALGALIRNDDPSELTPLTAIELVAFSAINPQVWMILDLLSIPADILVSVGNIRGPITPFSNLPKTVRVETHYEYRLAAVDINNPTPGSVSTFAKPKVLTIHQRSKLRELFTDASYPYQNFPNSQQNRIL